MQKNKAKVSVIMATYNGEKYVTSAIESILNQTMKNFELIIVDDASTDGTVNIIKKYNDLRIHFFQNEKNEGISFTRNRAISESCAPYITILDQDDISLPCRLEIQTNFLDTHPDFGFIGSGETLINECGRPLYITWKNKLPAEKMPGMILFQNYFGNGSTMIRRVALPKGEIYADSPAEDYNLWLRVDKKWKMWSLPKVLLKYRIHDKNASTLQGWKRREVVNKMIARALMRLEIVPSEEELRIHLTNSTYSGKDLQNFINKREQWLKKLKQQNNRIQYYDPEIFKIVLAEIWLTTCSNNAMLGMKIWRKFWKSELSTELNKKEKFALLLIFLIKCILKRNVISLRNIVKKTLNLVGLKTVVKKILKL